MVLEVTIFTTPDLSSYNNSIYGDQWKSAFISKYHLEAAIDDAGYSYSVTVSYDDSFDPNDSWTGNQLLNNFGDFAYDHPDGSSDSNLLLTKDKPSDATAGRGYVRGTAAYKKFGDLISLHERDADATGDSDSDVESTIRGMVHEVGHNFGMTHERGEDDEGVDGLRYTDINDTTYATPMGCAAGDTNTCGTDCSLKPVDKWQHYYSDCEKSYINDT